MSNKNISAAMDILADLLRDDVILSTETNRERLIEDWRRAFRLLRASLVPCEAAPGVDRKRLLAALRDVSEEAVTSAGMASHEGVLGAALRDAAKSLDSICARIRAGDFDEEEG